MRSHSDALTGSVQYSLSQAQLVGYCTCSSVYICMYTVYSIIQLHMLRRYQQSYTLLVAASVSYSNRIIVTDFAFLLHYTCDLLI
jgi:hypothetical protein